MSDANCEDLLIGGRPLAELKVVDLRKELEIRNLPKSGKKNELIDRLKNYLLTNDDEAEVQTANQQTTESYKGPNEYRSLCEVQPISKSPVKSPLKSKSPETSPSPKKTTETRTEEPISRVNEKLSELHQQDIPQSSAEETFHTANDLSQSDWDSSHANQTSEMVDESIKSEATDTNVEDQKSCDGNSDTKNEESAESPKSSTSNSEKKEEEEEHPQKGSNIETYKETKNEIFVESPRSSASSDSEKIKENDNVEVAADDIYADELANVGKADIKKMASEEGITEKKAEDELDYEEEVRDEEVHDSEVHDKEVCKEEVHDEEVRDEELSEDKNGVELKEEPPEISPTIEDLKSQSPEVHTEGVVSVPQDDGEIKPSIQEDKTPEGLIRLRELSPARNKVSALIHIRNLKRPFTVKTLKELLANFGKLSDEEFWIDNIKTNCIAKFETEEQAKLARERLHHVVWPPSSDTSLTVEYTNDDKLARRRGEDVVAAKPSDEPLNMTFTVENRNHSITSSKDGRRESTDLYVTSQKRKLDDDTPKKQLEDLFRKTVAKPPVYYLPLSDSEAEKRWAQKKKVLSDKKSHNGHVNGSGRDLSLDEPPRRMSRGSPERKRERRDSPIRRRR